MFSLWVLFGLLAPLFWGIANVGDRYLSSVTVKNEYALTFAASVGRLPFAIIFLWIAGWFVPDLKPLILVLISGFLSVFPFLFYFKALQKEEASRVMLLYYTTSPILTFFFSMIILGEKFTGYDIAGSLLLIIAAILTIVKFQKDFLNFHKGVLWVLLSSVTWSFSDVLQKYLMPSFPSSVSLLAWIFIGSFFASFLFLLLPEFLKNCKPRNFHWSGLSWWLLAANVVLFVLGTFTFLEALAIGKVALTVVLSASQPFFVFIFELAMRKIRPSVWEADTSTFSLIAKTAAFCLMVAGVWLFTFSGV